MQSNQRKLKEQEKNLFINPDELASLGLNQLSNYYKIVEDRLYENGKKRFFDSIGYHPHPEQLKIHKCTAKHKVCIAGRRSGKSAGAEKEGFYKLMKPNQRVAVIATLGVGVEKIFEPLTRDIKQFLPEREILQNSLALRKIRLANGSVAVGFTAKNIDAVLGDQFDQILMDEAAKMKVNVWDKYVSPTLVDREGEALFITTPEGRNNWMTELLIRGQKLTHPEWKSFKFTSYDNPHLSVEYLEEKRRTTDPRTFRQEYLADCNVFEGMVYDEFDPTVHCIDESEIPFHRMDLYFVGADWGYNSPSAILVLCKDFDGNLYVIDEIYEERLSDTAIVNKFIELRKKYPKLKFGYADHTPRLIAAVNKEGFQLSKAKKDVKAGIQHIASKLMLNDIGKPSLFISWNCKHTINEIEQYCYPKTSDGISNIKEIPVKVNDHAVDALRYAAYSLEKGFKGGYEKRCW